MNKSAEPKGFGKMHGNSVPSKPCDVINQDCDELAQLFRLGLIAVDAIHRFRTEMG